MPKHVAQRLARYYRSLGCRVRVKRHQSPAGAFYHVELVNKKPLRT
jgi:hypothetical protein